MRNVNKIALLLLLLVFSIGFVSAADNSTAINDDTIPMDNTEDMEVNHNPILKDDKNLKQAQNREIIVNQKTGNDSTGLGTSDKPYYSLQKAISVSSDNDKIYLSGDKYVLPASTQDIFYKNITITSKDNTVLTRQSKSMDDTHVFQIANGHKVTFSDITFDKMSVKSLISNHGNLTLKNCIFKNSNVIKYTSDYYAIINNYQNLIVENCSFTNNKGNAGSALYNRQTLTVTNSNFQSNTAKNGSAIYNIGSVTVKNTTISDNTATDSGAIYNQKELKVINTLFKNNVATTSAAILNLQKATVDGCEFNNNYAEGHGIIIYNRANQAELSITNSLITNNNVFEDSLIANNHKATINNCTVTNNVCGDAIIYNKGTLSVVNSKSNNNEVLGWGGIIQSEGNLTATNNLFKKTIGAYKGGVICLYNSANTVISSNIFDSNNASDADGLGGAISIEKARNTTIRLNTFNNNMAYIGGAIYINSSSVDVCYNKFIKNTAESGSAIYNDGNNFKIRYNNFTANPSEDVGYNVNNYGRSVTSSANVNYYGTKYPSTIENNGNNGVITSNRFEDVIKAVSTTTTVQAISGFIGDRITLKATVKDNSNTNIEGGNVIFKLNGVTIKDNGKLTGSNNPLKVYVSNGVATTTIIADLSMKSISQITASYVGSTLYAKSDSSQAKAQIKPRTAMIVVSSSAKTIRQGQTLTLKAQIYDTTGGTRSTNIVKYADEFVYFKVNGITLKDRNGNMLKVKVVNGVASVNYTIPLGLSGVTDGKTMTPKNHTILAGFYNKNYKEDIRNTSTFNVERSNITITIANASINNRTHKLSLQATIKDYLGNKVSGPNKCIVKVNGISLKNGTQALYFYSTNGMLNINNINIPAYANYKTIEIVTQDRLAYKSQRNTTTTIKVAN